MRLYPVISTWLNSQMIQENISLLWQQQYDNPYRKSIYYGVYFNYQSNNKSNYDFAICTENPTAYTPVDVPDLTFYEIFHCKTKERIATWQMIWRKEQQGLLKRAYTIDFEKYLPNNKIEIYIAVIPHC